MEAILYPFMTLNDDTEIAHTELLQDGRVKVYIEKPDEQDCFHNAACYLPDYEWNRIENEPYELLLQLIHFAHTYSGTHWD